MHFCCSRRNSRENISRTEITIKIFSRTDISVTEHFRGHKLSPKGRTELIIGGSGAKFCAEFHGPLRFCVAPQKPMKQRNNMIFKSKQTQFLFAQKFASKYVRGQKVAWKYFRGHKVASKYFQRTESRVKICSKDRN